MNIKSLLLGSAAVLVAASTAQAADAIVVEPEPVEYVRICDAYGSGFFYIPGTETCMNINGYIRSTYEHYTETTGGVENQNHAGWGYRGRLNVDVRNETDWGTLRSQLRFQGDGNGGGDAATGIDRALISVAGFRLGYSDSFWTTAHGYGAGTPAIHDGFYNFDQAIFLDYTYAADNFALTVGVQDTNGTGDAAASFAFNTATGVGSVPVAATGNTAENVDYYIGGKYSDSWGNIAVTYMYDQNSINAVTAAVGGDAWKASVQLNNVGDSGWNFGAWYMADGDDATSYVTGGASASGAGGSGATTGGLVDYQWGVQLNGALSDNLTGYVLYTAAEAIGSSATYIDSNEVVVGLVWRPITGLAIQTEYYSGEADYVLAGSDSDRDGFLVRVTRSW